MMAIKVLEHNVAMQSVTFEASETEANRINYVGTMKKTNNQPDRYYLICEETPGSFKELVECLQDGTFDDGGINDHIKGWD